jgi:hypothetical protein
MSTALALIWYSQRTGAQDLATHNILLAMRQWLVCQGWAIGPKAKTMVSSKIVVHNTKCGLMSYIRLKLRFKTKI